MFIKHREKFKSENQQNFPPVIPNFFKNLINKLLTLQLIRMILI